MFKEGALYTAISEIEVLSNKECLFHMNGSNEAGKMIQRLLNRSATYRRGGGEINFSFGYYSEDHKCVFIKADDNSDLNQVFPLLILFAVVSGRQAQYVADALAIRLEEKSYLMASNLSVSK